jgi:hypothetical protein
MPRAQYTDRLGNASMKLRYSKLLAIAGTLIMLALELVFYSSRNKELTYSWVRAVGFPAVWAGARLFSGSPLTRRTDVFFNLYLVACLTVEGFLAGLCIDLIRTGSRAGTPTTR